MSQATNQQISSAKTILGLLVQLQADIKLIDCPEHKGAHSAILYCYGHKYAGIWECLVSGISDSHEHGRTEIISEEPWPITPTDAPAAYDVEVCADCGVKVE